MAAATPPNQANNQPVLGFDSATLLNESCDRIGLSYPRKVFVEAMLRTAAVSKWRYRRCPSTTFMARNYKPGRKSTRFSCA